MRASRIQVPLSLDRLLPSGSYSSGLHASKTPLVRPSPGSWAHRKTEMVGSTCLFSAHLPMPTGSPPNLIPSLPVPGSHPPEGVESHHLWPPPVSVGQDLSHSCQEAPLLLLRVRAPPLRTSPGMASGPREQGLFSISQVWEILLAFPLPGEACLWFQSRPCLPKTPRIPPALAPMASRRECCLLPALKARAARERVAAGRETRGAPPPGAPPQSGW